MTAPADLPPLPSPQWRNRIWWSLQLIIQNVFSYWCGYRSRGHEHVPSEGGALLLINHRSFLDPFLAGLPISRPVSYVARHDLFENSAAGWLLRRTYVIPINRNATGTASLREILRRLEHGFVIGMFPEGTRQSGQEPIGPLKPGFVSILRRAQVPVIPVAIAGADDALPRGAVFIRPRQVRVVYGEPLSATELSELSIRGREQELLEYVAGRMSESVCEARAWLTDRKSRRH